MPPLFFERACLEFRTGSFFMRRCAMSILLRTQASQICWRLECRRRLFRARRIIRTCRLRPSMPTPGLRLHITSCVTSTQKNKARRLTYRVMTCLCGLLFWTSPLRGLFFGRSPCRVSVVSFGRLFCELKKYSYVCGAGGGPTTVGASRSFFL